MTKIIMCKNPPFMPISWLLDLDHDIKNDNLGILSCYFNNVLPCSIFLKQAVQHTRNKEISLQIVSMFLIYSQKYSSFSDLDLDLEVIWRLKLIFGLKGIVVAYVKNTYKNQTTSNNGEIDLNMCENHSFYGSFWLL